MKKLFVLLGFAAVLTFAFGAHAALQWNEEGIPTGGQCYAPIGDQPAVGSYKFCLIDYDNNDPTTCSFDSNCDNPEQGHFGVRTVNQSKGVGQKRKCGAWAHICFETAAGGYGFEEFNDIVCTDGSKNLFQCEPSQLVQDNDGSASAITDLCTDICQNYYSETNAGNKHCTGADEDTCIEYCEGFIDDMAGTGWFTTASCR